MSVLFPQVDSTPNLESTHALHEPRSGAESYTTCMTEYRIPGYLVNPENLVKVLRERFKDNYKVKLRNDNYSISTPRKLTKNELIMCY
ncbi:hypothetical protein F4820DRAFT_439666 [Hypoxylon rubiginosum]|uniref:Uncharacterized protein n=1 Tax=Hypoxylon rubiginosum TaxID=110542 RepID=A0ACB9YK97_9PEZI|nr:hypothetical protein F4820DRAFT_439666 [Hypoxylon rubiginosum]